ncbi:uncharacterized protein LOC130891040 isoform X2 [Diorhabda carinulata]|uniref:uncharacterized protein LOC130891040 isoform X2 n=1 Tax=Diorhabda carinulata TaxID=1163345 RepID=UPI0025A30271|nr:uncharacterized protein LOC130891040 isoform X2 [Diorhabda carinulata]
MIKNWKLYNIYPYAIPVKECSLDMYKVPNITMMDLVNFLILSHSFYTGQQLKAYKSLQAYKQFEAGSVQELWVKQVNDEAIVVIAKVQHFQRKREKSLKIWIIILKDTSISSAHCTCMAGLSDVCNHISMVLLYMLRVQDMDWSKKTEKKTLSERYAPCLDEGELSNLLTKLQEIDINPAATGILQTLANHMRNDWLYVTFCI